LGAGAVVATDVHVSTTAVELFPRGYPYSNQWQHNGTASDLPASNQQVSASGHLKAIDESPSMVRPVPAESKDTNTGRLIGESVKSPVSRPLPCR